MNRIDFYNYILWLSAKRGFVRAVTDEAACAAVVRTDVTSARFDHHLNTASVGIVVSANWSTDIYVTEFTSKYFVLGFSNPALRGSTVSYRLTTSGGSLAVAADDETVTLTHNLSDATAAYFVTPSWNTAVYVSSKTADTIVYGFSVAPESAGTLYYGRFNLSTNAVLANVSIDDGAEVYSLTHNLSKEWVDVYSVPTWNTTAYTLDSTRAANAMSIGFSTSAPSGATIDIVAGIPT